MSVLATSPTSDLLTAVGSAEPCFAAAPADRPRAEAGVAAAYRAAGLAGPAHVLWVSSPAAGAVLAALLRDPSKSADVRAALPDGFCTLRSAGEEERILPVAEVLPLLAGLEAGASVREEVRTRPWERERAAAHAELGPAEWAAAWARTGGASWTAVHGLVQRVRAAVGELVSEEKAGVLRAATLDAVLGQHDSPWLGFFSSLGRLAPLRGLAEVAVSAGWWWPYENLVVLSERPAELHRDEPGRLHNGDGPALAYPDGFALHAWRGMPIPPGYIQTLGSLTAERIFDEANAEMRRVMLEHYGYDRYLAEIGAEPLSRDETGVLWRILLPGDEPIAMVEVVNSTPEPDGTRRTYYLRVPPGTRTAREGVAWTFGLTEAEYRPEKET